MSHPPSLNCSRESRKTIAAAPRRDAAQPGSPSPTANPPLIRPPLPNAPAGEAEGCPPHANISIFPSQATDSNLCPPVSCAENPKKVSKIQICPWITTHYHGLPRRYWVAVLRQGIKPKFFPSPVCGRRLLLGIKLPLARILRAFIIAPSNQHDQHQTRTAV